MDKEDVLFNIDLIKDGLKRNIPCVEYQLQYFDKTGYANFNERKEQNKEWYKSEADACVAALSCIENIVDDHVIFVDLGSGKNMKSIALLNTLMKNNKERRIVYIPVDINNVVLEWDSFIKQFDVHKTIIEVIPLCMNMTLAVDVLDTIIKDYNTYTVIFGCFCSGTIILNNIQFFELVQKIGQFIEKRGNGYLVMNLIELTDVTNEQWDRCLNGYEFEKQLESVLWGFKDFTKSDIDPKKFSYYRKFDEKFTTQGLEGQWSGCSYYAKAVEDMVVEFQHSRFSDLKLQLKKNDVIQLSLSDTATHFYDEQYLKSLAETNGMTVAKYCNTSEKYGMAYAVMVHSSSGS